MHLVIDANILFSVLIKNSISSEVMFKENITLYSPEFIFDELSKYKKYILTKTKRSYKDFNKLIVVFNRRVNIIKSKELTPFIKKAKEISPDIKDIAYFAVALKFDIPIWSNDKELKDKQNIVKVYSTSELLDLLNKT